MELSLQCHHVALGILHHLSVVFDLLNEGDGDDPDSAGDRVFDEREYFSTLSYLLACLDFNITAHDATMNKLERLPAGQLERESCARVLQKVRALMAELDAYRNAGYAPAPRVIG